MEQPRDFDLVAAQLRADLGDLDAFLQALAAKLEGAFPAAVRVERGGGFLRGPKRVSQVTVTLGEQIYSVERTRAGVAARRAQAVRGVVLKREDLPLETWVDELAGGLTEVAGETERGRVALQRLLEQ